MFFSKLICDPSRLDVQLLCVKFQTKLKTFLLNYSYLFWGLLFIGTQCILMSVTTVQCVGDCLAVCPLIAKVSTLYC